MDRTSYRYNLEYRARTRARMLELAKQLLSGDLGVVAAAQLLLLFTIASSRRSVRLDVFVGINSETDSFPLGDVRQQWSPDSLESEDLRLATAERFWNLKAMDAGARLLRVLESATDER